MTQETTVTASTADKQAFISTIVSSYVGHNSVALSDIPALMAMVGAQFDAITGTAVEVPAETVTKMTPAQIRKSITPDAIISFIDGKAYKTLKRHLTTHGLTVEDYKAKFGLPADYPTTAPSYSEARSAMAKALGLGQGGRGRVAGRRKATASA